MHYRNIRSYGHIEVINIDRVSKVTTDIYIAFTIYIYIGFKLFESIQLRSKCFQILFAFLIFPIEDALSINYLFLWRIMMETLIQYG